MHQVGRRLLLGVSFGVLAAGEAHAAGYALREQSASALGNAFAGNTAGAEDVTYIFANPAVLGQLDEHGGSLGGSWVSPTMEVKDATATTGAGTPVSGRDEVKNAADDQYVPYLHLAAPVGDRVRLGLSLTAPFGLSTEYPESWVGRYHAVESELITYNINPAVGIKISDRISIGIGFQAQYADGKLSNAVDFGTIGAGEGVPGAIPGAQDGFARLDGDDWGYGWNVGLLVEPIDGTRLGIAYRSEIDYRLHGDARFTDDEAGIAATLRAARGAFASSDASLDITTPASLSFGIHQDVGYDVSFMAEVSWTDWSEFDELKVEFDNPAQDDVVAEQRWDDSWFYAVGATWKPWSALTLRTGVAYDESPTPNRYRTPRMPDEDRYWLAFGATYKPQPWIGLDVGYAHVWVDDASLELQASDRGNEARGNLSAEYDSSIDIVTVGLKVQF
jgi:long-chain fatty acid transport protein